MPATKDGYFDFSDAPGDGESLDDIFAQTDPSNVTVTPATTTPPEPETPGTQEPFLKTATGTVYTSADDAVKGIEHKDALITQLRQELLQATNVDPLRKKQEPAVDDPNLVSYVSNPKKYFEDIKNAKTEEEVLQVQSRFVQEQMAPYAPVIANVIKSQAIEAVTSDVPNFRTFLGSTEYKETLDSFPLLKQSIAIAESNPNMAGDLAQLYRMSFDAASGRNLPKVVQGSTTVTPPVQTRPTVSSTPATPPPTSSQVAPPSFGTADGRKSIMDQQVARGVENLRF